MIIYAFRGVLSNRRRSPLFLGSVQGQGSIRAGRADVSAEAASLAVAKS